MKQDEEQGDCTDYIYADPLIRRLLESSMRPLVQLSPEEEAAAVERAQRVHEILRLESGILSIPSIIDNSKARVVRLRVWFWVLIVASGFALFTHGSLFRDYETVALGLYMFSGVGFVLATVVIHGNIQEELRRRKDLQVDFERMVLELSSLAQKSPPGSDPGGLGGGGSPKV